MKVHKQKFTDTPFFPERFGDAPFHLASGEVLDHESEGVHAFVDRALRGTSRTNRSAAVALYYAVRDGLFYEIFGTYVGAGLSASAAIAEGRGFCLHKAIVYAAACRAAGVPCRVLAATVRNHISSRSISVLVGGDVFLHWYNEVLLVPLHSGFDRLAPEAVRSGKGCFQAERCSGRGCGKDNSRRSSLGSDQ